MDIICFKVFWRLTMKKHFCGWYYRCQSDTQTLAIIPSVHKTPDSAFCNIQLITDSDAFQLSFPYSDLRRNKNGLSIGKNLFGSRGVTLDIQKPELQVSGDLAFGSFTPIDYDIMGPFRLIPFLQCRHSVFSMKHTVDGELRVNGICYRFANSDGYLEGDRGSSFPSEYAWTQCFFPEGSLMLSVADVPFGKAHITGVIGIIRIEEKEYRLATYLGAKVVKIENGEVVVRQRKLTLTAKRLDAPGHPLQAPVCGSMSRTIYEHPACNAYYRFEDNSRTLLELNAKNAAFEYEY